MISQSLQQHTQSLHRSKPDCFWCWERKWTQAPFLTQKLPPMNNCSQRKKSFSQWSLTGCKTHTRRQVSPIANNKGPTQNEPSGDIFGGWFIFFACLSGFFAPLLSQNALSELYFKYYRSFAYLLWFLILFQWVCCVCECVFISVSICFLQFFFCIFFCLFVSFY